MTSVNTLCFICWNSIIRFNQYLLDIIDALFGQIITQLFDPFWLSQVAGYQIQCDVIASDGVSDYFFEESPDQVPFNLKIWGDFSISLNQLVTYQPSVNHVP